MGFDLRTKIVSCVVLMGMVLPVHLYAQTVSDSITTGTTWLVSQQSDMGFWGFKGDPLKTEFTADDLTTTYVRDTLQAVTALQVVSAPPTDYASALDWVEGFPFFSTEELGQKIRILASAGRSTNDPENSILTYRNTDGAFGGFNNYPSENLDTALALQGLAAGGSASTALNALVTFLLSAQNPDGGWGFVPGQASHVYYTALVMQALEMQVQTAAIANVLSKATAYLLAQQQADGSFGEGGGNVPDTALAFMAISKTTGNVTVRSAAIGYLLGQQLADGSWNDDPYSTALALQALKAGESLDREIDNDGDGYTEVQGDCNDADAAVYPGAPDLTVDGVDQDCNGIDGPPVGNVDGDGDGYSPLQGDCDDTNPAIHPGAVDIPGNGIDENCDGQDGATVVDIQSVSLMKLINGVEVPTSAFRPYETVNIHITINDPGVPLTLFVTDAAGQVFNVREDGGAYFFDTVNHVPGSYTLTTWALDANSGVILEEATASFTIESGIGIASGVLAAIPSSTHIGATETVILAVQLNNGSNIPVSLSIQHEVKSPSGVLIHGGTNTSSLAPETSSTNLTLTTFNQTFSESGSYPVTAWVYNGSTLLATLNATVSSAPLIRIEPSITLTPGTVLPDGDKRIHIDIHLEGVEQTP